MISLSQDKMSRTSRSLEPQEWAQEDTKPNVCEEATRTTEPEQIILEEAMQIVVHFESSKPITSPTTWEYWQGSNQIEEHGDKV